MKTFELRILFKFTVATCFSIFIPHHQTHTHTQVFPIVYILACINQATSFPCFHASFHPYSHHRNMCALRPSAGLAFVCSLAFNRARLNLYSALQQQAGLASFYFLNVRFGLQPGSLFICALWPPARLASFLCVCVCVLQQPAGLASFPPCVCASAASRARIFSFLCTLWPQAGLASISILCVCAFARQFSSHCSHHLMTVYVKVFLYSTKLAITTFFGKKKFSAYFFPFRQFKDHNGKTIPNCYSTIIQISTLANKIVAAL